MSYITSALSGIVGFGVGTTLVHSLRGLSSDRIGKPAWTATLAYAGSGLVAGLLNSSPLSTGIKAATIAYAVLAGSFSGCEMALQESVQIQGTSANYFGDSIFHFGVTALSSSLSITANVLTGLYLEKVLTNTSYSTITWSLGTMSIYVTNLGWNYALTRYLSNDRRDRH